MHLMLTWHYYKRVREHCSSGAPTERYVVHLALLWGGGGGGGGGGRGRDHCSSGAPTKRYIVHLALL